RCCPRSPRGASTPGSASPRSTPIPPAMTTSRWARSRYSRTSPATTTSPPEPAPSPSLRLVWPDAGRQGGVLAERKADCPDLEAERPQPRDRRLRDGGRWNPPPSPDPRGRATDQQPPGRLAAAAEALGPRRWPPRPW